MPTLARLALWPLVSQRSLSPSDGHGSPLARSLALSFLPNVSPARPLPLSALLLTDHTGLVLRPILSNLIRQANTPGKAL